MQYRKRPVIVDVLQLTQENAAEVEAFIGRPCRRQYSDDDKTTISGLLIDTLEGDMLASVGDYIIKGVQGEFYPCKPDIFAATYEPVD